LNDIRPSDPKGTSAPKIKKSKKEVAVLEAAAGFCPKIDKAG
jgi:hypothetical protein